MIIIIIKIISNYSKSEFDGDATTNKPIVVNYGKPMSSQSSAIASDHTLSHPAWTAKSVAFRVQHERHADLCSRLS